jgi:hypothetical protein
VLYSIAGAVEEIGDKVSLGTEEGVFGGCDEKTNEGKFVEWEVGFKDLFRLGCKVGKSVGLRSVGKRVGCNKLGVCEGTSEKGLSDG